MREKEREVGPLGRKFKMRERLYVQIAQLSFYLLFFIFSFLKRKIVIIMFTTNLALVGCKP